ncbi:DsbC family protein [Burkholderia sp. MR1-5-21]
MKTLRRYIAAGAAALTLTTGIDGLAQSDPVTEKLAVTLQVRLGMETSIKSITKTPIAGLFEVNLGKRVIYSDATGNYLILGDIVDARTRANLTQARNDELNKIDFASLPFDNAVKHVKGNGARKIAVFADPNCGYCKQLESTLINVDNVTVYTFLYPILTPDSKIKAKSIWCAPDREKAWQAWMLEGRAPSAAGTCDTAAIQSNLALGQQLNVAGTPTIILADGRRLPGVVKADQLDKALAAIR